MELLRGLELDLWDSANITITTKSNPKEIDMIIMALRIGFGLIVQVRWLLGKECKKELGRTRKCTRVRP